MLPVTSATAVATTARAHDITLFASLLNKSKWDVTHRVNDAAKLDDAAVSGALDDAAVTGGDERVDQVAAQCPDLAIVRSSSAPAIRL